MSWAYSLFSIQGFSALLGVTEIVIALLIAARPLSARAALVGSASAVADARSGAVLKPVLRIA